MLGQSRTKAVNREQVDSVFRRGQWPHCPLVVTILTSEGVHRQQRRVERSGMPVMYGRNLYRQEIRGLLVG